MTREEASNRLKQWIRNGCDGMTDEQLGYIEGWFHKSDKEALDMAIKALEQEPSGDLIRRQAVIDACEQSINILEAVDRIMDLQPVKQEPKWIPVSERVPEEYGEYLVTWTGILGETKRTRPLLGIAEYEIYEPENYEDWITTVNEFERYRDIKVSAWMPLPEPYEPQESEE